MTTVLVTGDTGFVGSALVQELHNFGLRVIGVSRSTSVDTAAVGPNYRHISSATDQLTEELIGEPIEAVFDLAWNGSMGEARGNKELQHANVDSSVHVLRVAAACGAKLYLGTGTITELTALSDGAPEGPATVYGLAKNLAHQETLKVALELDVDHIWARLGNTYSEHDTSSRFLNATLGKLATGAPVSLMTGNQPFDFIHLEDAVRALSILAMVGASGEAYYVGNGDVRTIADFVKVAKNVLESPSTIDAAEAKLSLTPEDLDSTPLKRLGYHPAISFEEGVELWKTENA